MRYVLRRLLLLLFLIVRNAATEDEEKDLQSSEQKEMQEKNWLAAERAMIDAGVNDFDILMNVMKPEVIKKLTEDEDRVMSEFEADVISAQEDVTALTQESHDILDMLHVFEAGVESDDAFSAHHEAQLHALKDRSAALSDALEDSLKHLDTAKGHMSSHREHLRQVHAEIFTTQLAANVMSLLADNAEGVDYDSGNIKLNIAGMENSESLELIKERLLLELAEEKNKANQLTQYLVDPAVMQLDFGLLVDICVMIIAAAIGGILASFVRIPPLVGYIIGGLIIGPSGMRIVKDITSAHTVTHLGSVFILFRKGVDFPLDWNNQSPLALRIGGSVMLSVIIGLYVFAAFSDASRTPSESMMFGVAMCISSTSVVRTLVSKTYNAQAHVVTFAKKVTVIGSINQLTMGIWLALPIALVGGLHIMVRILFTVIIFGLASVAFRNHIAPAAFSYIATRPNLDKSNTKALLFLATVAWCLLFSLSTDILGLSIESGAFASGVYLAGMSNVHEISDMIHSVEVLLGSLYFASVGMILNVEWSLQHAWSIFLIATQVAALKVFAAFVMLTFFKFSRRNALLASVALAQVGDFSLVYISKSHRLGLVGRTLYLHMLMTIVIMMVTLPALLRYLFKTVPLSREDGLSEIGLGNNALMSEATTRGGAHAGTALLRLIRSIFSPQISHTQSMTKDTPTKGSSDIEMSMTASRLDVSGEDSELHEL